MGEEIHIILSASTAETGWVAIGFNTQQMSESDVVLGHKDSSSFVVRDMHFGDASAAISGPVVDDVENIPAATTEGSYENGKLTIRFVRKFNTGDSSDEVLVIPPAATSAPIQFIFANGDHVGQYHGFTRKTPMTIDLLDATLSSCANQNNSTVDCEGEAAHHFDKMHMINLGIMVGSWLIYFP